MSGFRREAVELADGRARGAHGSQLRATPGSQGRESSGIRPAEQGVWWVCSASEGSLIPTFSRVAGSARWESRDP